MNKPANAMFQMPRMQKPLKTGFREFRGCG